MTEKDYSLLRPFDLEAAKDWAKICWHEDGDIALGVMFIRDRVVPVFESAFSGKAELVAFFTQAECRKLLRLAPLCWVDGKPVYPDTPMEREDNGWPVSWSATGIAWQDDAGNWSDDGVGFKIRWPRPKPVKRWINVYNVGYDTEAAADQAKTDGRIACIEIELPPLPDKAEVGRGGES